MLEKRVTSVEVLRQELSRYFESEELDNAQGVTDTLEELCVTPILDEASFPLFFHDVKKGEKGLLGDALDWHNDPRWYSVTKNGFSTSSICCVILGAVLARSSRCPQSGHLLSSSLTISSMSSGVSGLRRFCL